MTFSVTGIKLAPDIGFKTGHRHTAEGARELAVDFAADGLREIEVRDHEGNLRSIDELERATGRPAGGQSARRG